LLIRGIATVIGSHQPVQVRVQIEVVVKFGIVLRPSYKPSW
jgi:hypothetical protein